MLLYRKPHASPPYKFTVCTPPAKLSTATKVWKSSAKLRRLSSVPPRQVSLGSILAIDGLIEYPTAIRTYATHATRVIPRRRWRGCTEIVHPEVGGLAIAAFSENLEKMNRSRTRICAVHPRRVGHREISAASICTFHAAVTQLPAWICDRIISYHPRRIGVDG